MSKGLMDGGWGSFNYFNINIKRQTNKNLIFFFILFFLLRNYYYSSCHHLLLLHYYRVCGLHVQLNYDFHLLHYHDIYAQLGFASISIDHFDISG